LSGLYYFVQSDSFEPFVKLGVSAWNAKGENSAFQYDNSGVLTTITGEGKEIISLVDYAKKYKISHSNLINKAKRQTIEAFSEKGKWKIGN
jgi:hypothetical protein